jgi:hypothetical protein
VIRPFANKQAKMPFQGIPNPGTRDSSWKYIILIQGNRRCCAQEETGGFAHVEIHS